MITDDEVMRVLEQANPASVDDPIPMFDIARYRDVLDVWNTTTTIIDIEPTPTASTSGRRWPILIVAAAAVVLVVGALVGSGDDDTQNDSPANTPSTVPSTTKVATWLDKLMVRPLDCGQQCPWSPELTAQALGPAFACTGSPGNPLCPLLAVSPDGTLVALDRNAGTLTWYEEEPRVVSIVLAHPPSIDEQSGFVAMGIGPHDIAYISVGPRPSALVAVAPSGAEITRVETPRGAPRLYPTATGLSATFVDRLDDGQLMPPNGALWMPWVDLNGNPITDDRPYPTATAMNSAIEVQLGDREWLLAEQELPDDTGLLTFPRSDGGVVMVLMRYDGQANDEPVLNLSTDGTIQRYVIDAWSTAVLPDGSLIVEHDLQLFRLTPPA